jgi:acetyl esterase
MPLDPQAQALLDQIAAMGAPPLNQMPVAMARVAAAAMTGFSGTGPEMARVDNLSMPGPAGDIPLRIFTPGTSPPYPILVYYHGGGWVIGSLDSHDAVCRSLAIGTPCIVVAVDYRLAPENKFPGAVVDAYAAAQWVAANAAGFGGDAQHIAVGGDSAGGNLAAVVAQMAHEHAAPALMFQLLIYPVTDAASDTPSYRDNGAGYLLTDAMMEWFWNHYLPDGVDRASALHSPLRAKSLKGLPRALVITAEYDPLRDEGEAYAARLSEAGVAVKLTRYEGMIHGFFGLGTLMNKANQAVDESTAALRAAFGAAAR